MDLTGINSIADFAKGIVDRIWPDPATKAKALLDIEDLKQKGELAQLAADTGLAQGQLDINKEEAKSTNWFVAGWRPCVGWIAAFALAYAAIINPIGQFIAEVYFGYKGPFPVIDTTITMQLLFGLLGLGAFRTAEKIKNAEGNR